MGEILSDGAGGSLLRGRFYPHPLTLLLAAVALGALLAAGLYPDPGWQGRLTGLAMGLYLGWQLLPLCLRPETGAGELPALLRVMFPQSAPSQAR